MLTPDEMRCKSEKYGSIEKTKEYEKIIIGIEKALKNHSTNHLYLYFDLERGVDKAVIEKVADKLTSMGFTVEFHVETEGDSREMHDYGTPPRLYIKW